MFFSQRATLHSVCFCMTVMDRRFYVGTPEEKYADATVCVLDLSNIPSYLFFQFAEHFFCVVHIFFPEHFLIKVSWAIGIEEKANWENHR